MYPQNGPPLSLDIQLRLTHHIPTFPPLRLLRHPQHVHARLLPLRAPPPHLGQPLLTLVPRALRTSHVAPPHPHPRQRLRAPRLEHPLHPRRALHAAQHLDDRELGDRTTRRARQARQEDPRIRLRERRSQGPNHPAGIPLRCRLLRQRRPGNGDLQPALLVPPLWRGAGYLLGGRVPRQRIRRRVEDLAASRSGQDVENADPG